MTQRISIMRPLVAIAVALAAAACGSPQSRPQSTTAPAISGVASTGSAATTVSVKDSSATPQVATAAAAADGAFRVDVTGMTAPFALMAEWSDASGSGKMYSLATEAGTANVNTLSDALMAASSETGSPDDAYTSFGGQGGKTSRTFVGLLNQLSTVLAPLYSLYHVTSPITDDAFEKGSNLLAMLKDVKFTVSQGTLTVTNKATGAVIYTAPLGAITSGTFHPENMPAGPGTGGTIDGAALYTASCSGCHGPLATSSVKGATSARIQAAISANLGGMGKFSSLSAAQIDAIASALSGTAPSACTSFTYSAWGACQPNNTQMRTVLTSSPAGCTGGSPVTSQACTYVPPACTYTYSAWSACSASGTQTRTVLTTSPAGCAGTPVLTQACTPPVTNPVTQAMVVSSCTGCHGLTSNTTVFRSGGYTVVGRSAAQWLTTVNNMVGLGASLAPGTTAQNYADYLATAP